MRLLLAAESSALGTAFTSKICISAIMKQRAHPPQNKRITEATKRPIQPLSRFLGRRQHPLCNMKTCTCCLWNERYYFTKQTQSLSTDILKYRALVCQAGLIDLYARAHGGSHHAGADILALGSGGLRLDDGAQQRVEVLRQLLCAKGDLAERAVDDVGLIQAVLDTCQPWIR